MTNRLAAATLDRVEEQAAPPPIPLDQIDRALLHELLDDGRASQEELARRVMLSRPAVSGRMRRLEESGAVVNYTAVLNWERIGYPLLAFVFIRTTGNCGNFARSVVDLSDGTLRVEECHRVTGDWCLFTKVRARSSKALERFIDRLRESPHVFATMTTLSFSSTGP